jgi:hypothetical protein
MPGSERLQAQLRDGAFHYVAVAQRFTPPVLRTLQYLNSAMRSSRFSAVELVRFEGTDHAAFEARFVAVAEPVKGPTGTRKTALAGVDALIAFITDDDYRHCVQDLFEALVNLDGLTVYWGTTGCSLRVSVPDRRPLSVGWIFPPGPPRWMGLTDLTLGWYEDASGPDLSDSGRAALDDYSRRLSALPGASEAKPVVIRGWTFAPAAVVDNATQLEEAVRSVVAALVAS